MSFAAASLYNITGMPPGFATYIYKSDTDAALVVQASGYFNNTDDAQIFAADDQIIVIGDQGAYTLSVVSVTAGAVATSLVAANGGGSVSAGSTLTLSKAEHDGRTIYLDTLTGSVVTLPAATGSGMKVRILVSVERTSNSHNILCTGDDTFKGVIYQVDVDTSDAIAAYPAIAADTFDDIAMNGTTQGGLIGDWFEFEDILTDVWAVKGFVNANGTVVTPWATT